MHPQFKNALELGLVEPAVFDGKHVELGNQKLYQVAEHGTKMMMQRFGQYADVLQKHERLKISIESIQAALIAQQATMNAIMEVVLDTYKHGGPIDNDALTSINSLKEDFMRIGLHLSERLTLGYDLYQSYEIAAIWFITDDEDPAYSDSTKIKQKIELMLARPELYGFFLRLPLNNYSPLQMLFDEHTLSLAFNQALLELSDLKVLSLKSLTSGLSNGMISIINYREAQLQTSMNTIEKLSSIFIER